MPIALPVIVRVSLAVMALGLTGPLFAQQSFSTLEERMTGAEFQATGLGKLSAEELAALNRWIQARSLTENEVANLSQGSEPGTASTTEDRRGFPQSRGGEPINSRLVGSFSGWSGRGDEFELQNGMVWRQAESGTMAIGTLESPQVTIRSGLLGAWYLSVEGYNRRVRVERVR